MSVDINRILDLCSKLDHLRTSEWSEQFEAEQNYLQRLISYEMPYVLERHERLIDERNALFKENERLRGENEQLRAETVRLRFDNDLLRAENDLLDRCLDRFGSEDEQ